MRVVFFGMECGFSRPPLAALLAAGLDVRAVVLPRRSYPPGPPGRMATLPLRGTPPYTSQHSFDSNSIDGNGQSETTRDAPVHAPRTGMGAPPPIRPLAPPSYPARGRALPVAPVGRGVAGLAWAAGIHVLEVGDLADKTVVGQLRDLRPDLIVVACFPRLLPPALLRVPRLGALNVHPSLLPAYRGPHPLFWVFHDGLERVGVTVHLMDAGADTGPIVSQRAVALPDGVAYAEAERRCAEEGARMLVDAVRAAGEGRMGSHPQPAAGVSHAPAPREGDFVVTPDWSARRAFNFVCGMAAWGRPVRLRVGAGELAVREAVAFDETAAIGAPFERAGDRARVCMLPGVLTCVLA